VARGLTPKQEKFAQVYVQTSNASEAYRQAYDCKKISNAAIAVEGCRLLDNPDVALMVKTLREEIKAKHSMTVDDIIRELEEARAMAMTGERPQTASMVAATMGKAKVLGLIVDKAEVKGSLNMTLYDGEQAARMASMLNATQPN
jgi:phage terminase small subunit